MPAQLDNYLRTYRKQSGLTQTEVSFLLGWHNRAQFSRYEKRRRQPPLRAALACQALFGVPAAQLFAGINDSVATPLARRMRELAVRLRATSSQRKQARNNLRKLAWLSTRGY